MTQQERRDEGSAGDEMVARDVDASDSQRPREPTPAYDEYRRKQPFTRPNEPASTPGAEAGPPFDTGHEVQPVDQWTQRLREGSRLHSDEPRVYPAQFTPPDEEGEAPED